MTPEAILTALADPTRRAILDRLRDGPLSVGVIADPLPVSRPAVSQHLRLMVDAGLVTLTPVGRRNLYGLASGGAAPLVGWLGDLSARVLEDVETGLVLSLTVRLSPVETWQLFCDDLALWWPVAVVSLSARTAGALPQAVVLEDVIGGALREVLFDGQDAIWATVVAHHAGAMLVLDWRLGTPDGSRVEISVAPEAGGARLTLRHDADTPEMAEMWDLVLMQRFAAAAASSLSNY
ncbi:MAG: metalloregulator ArsR/SmtB family transcription factor [Jannaschia sp.]